MRDPRAVLMPGGHSPWLSQGPTDPALGRLYRAALRSFSGALGWLVFDAARQLGPRRVAMIAKGDDELADDDLGYVLLSAERLTQMLAHLHIGRLLAQQADRWPERRPQAERFLRRTTDICALNARRITRGDRSA